MAAHFAEKQADRDLSGDITTPCWRLNTKLLVLFLNGFGYWNLKQEDC